MIDPVTFPPTAQRYCANERLTLPPAHNAWSGIERHHADIAPNMFGVAADERYPARQTNARARPSISIAAALFEERHSDRFEEVPTGIAVGNIAAVEINIRKGREHRFCSSHKTGEISSFNDLIAEEYHPFVAMSLEQNSIKGIVIVGQLFQFISDFIRGRCSERDKIVTWAESSAGLGFVDPIRVVVDKELAHGIFSHGWRFYPTNQLIISIFDIGCVRNGTKYVASLMREAVTKPMAFRQQQARRKPSAGKDARSRAMGSTQALSSPQIWGRRRVLRVLGSFP